MCLLRPPALATHREPLLQRYAAVFLQHEYGIFGGYRGEFIIPLLRLSASVPVVTTLHTVESVPSPMVQHALAQVLRHSAAVVTLSPSGCRAVERWSSTVGLPESEGLCTSIHHGVPQLPLCLKGPLKKALGMSPATFLIMAGGLLSAPKGVEHILVALRSIKVSVPSIQLLVAGEPHPVLGKAYLEELQSRVSELGVESLVQFRSRYAPQAELERLYGAADVFICAHTSPEQTSSGTMLLAMAAGAVVVSTPFAQAAELLTPGIGLLVPFENASAISEAVIGIAREPRRAQRLRAAAYATMSSRAWPAVAARYAELALHPPRVTQIGVPRFELGGGATGALTFEGEEFVEAGNEALSLAVVRNVNWVDGVGPGWYPIDTFLSRRRPVWGLDSLLLNGCFMNYQPLGEKTQTTSLRVLGDLDTSFKLLRPAGIEQGWAGAVGAASAHVSRRMVLLPLERESVSLEVQASLSGAKKGAAAWLTTGFDQLSSTPGVWWDSVTAHDTAGVLSVHAACDWDGVSMAVSHLRVFAMHGRRVADGAATAVTVSMRSGAEDGVHTVFACTADRRLQYLAFDMPLQHEKDGMSARATADVRWT